LFKLPAAEARAAQDKIYALEVKQEDAAKSKAVSDAAAAEQRRREQAEAAAAAAEQRRAQEQVRAEKAFDDWYNKIYRYMYYPVGSNYPEDKDFVGCMFWPGIEANGAGKADNAENKRTISWWHHFHQDRRHWRGRLDRRSQSRDDKPSDKLRRVNYHQRGGQARSLTRGALVFSKDGKDLTVTGSFTSCGTAYTNTNWPR